MYWCIWGGGSGGTGLCREQVLGTLLYWGEWVLGALVFGGTGGTGVYGEEGAGVWWEGDVGSIGVCRGGIWGTGVWGRGTGVCGEVVFGGIGVTGVCVGRG